MYSLLRTIGSGIGVSVIATVLTSHAQIAWHNLGGQLQPFNQAMPLYLGHLGLNESAPQSVGVLVKVLAQQSQMIGFLDAYIFVTFAFAAMAPLVFIMKNTHVTEAPEAAMAAAE